MAVPQTSGAKGSSGSHEEPESVNQAGQYPASDPFSGVGFPMGTGAPGTQGRMAGDQTFGPPTTSTDLGSTIYGNTVEDHALDSDPARPDGYYPSTEKLPVAQEPTSTGAGRGSVRAPGNPNAHK